jgi:hypothetical protein
MSVVQNEDDDFFKNRIGLKNAEHCFLCDKKLQYPFLIWRGWTKKSPPRPARNHEGEFLRSSDG